MPLNNNSQLQKEGEEHFLAGRFEQAKIAFENVIANEPENVAANFWFGASLLQLQQSAEAIPYFKTVLNADPTNTTVLNFLGAAYQNVEQHTDAIVCFEEVLKSKPENIAGRVNLAISLSALNRHEAALQYLLPFVDAGGAGPDIIYNAALCSQKLLRYPQAKALYEQVLHLIPNHVDAVINLGLVYRALQDMEKAKVMFEKARFIAPQNIDAKYNYASLLIEMKEWHVAEQILVEVLQERPEYLEAMNDYGQIRFQQMRFHEAISFYNRCIELRPDWWHGLFNRALAYHELGEYQLALEDYQRALVSDPENHLIHFGFAETLLSLGRYQEGFFHYEYRLKFNSRHIEKFTIERWKGQDLSGKWIYVYEEQGAGDTFQYIRCIQELKKLGAKVVLESRQSSYTLLTWQPYIDEVVLPSDEAKVKECDYFSPLLSLPYYLAVYEKNDFDASPYITVPAAEAATVKLPERNKGNLKAGIVWSGNKSSIINRKRHCSLNDLTPLLTMKDVDFYSLQIDEARQELYQFPGGDNIIDLSGMITDFSDTARLIQSLDFVISIDTSIAHLAAAMGKKVYLLLAKVPDWRWQGKTDTSEWYASMKIFRQKNFQDWSAPIKELHETLTAKGTPVFTEENPLVLALTSGENFGWGVCSKYIHKHLENKTGIRLYQEDGYDYSNRTIFHAIQNNKLTPLHNVRGRVNIGYTFFEYLLDNESIENARQYDLVLGGSTWNMEMLKKIGIEHADVLVQGVDPEVFYPITEEKNPNLFVVFSGGKFELRKGQDLTLRAVGILQQRYKDVILMNAWYNMWPQTMLEMSQSRHIKFDLRGNSWGEAMEYLYLINGLDRERILTLGLTQNTQLRNIYAKTDIGLFPNRCEGGTNLVLMEYMACAKPVIASYNTGHKDVLRAGSSVMLEKMQYFPVYNNGQLSAEWEEPDLEEIVEKLDYAYHHREEMKQIGVAAGALMKEFTWEKTADAVLGFAERMSRP